jgi:para-nitrobenzyl esterase
MQRRDFLKRMSVMASATASVPAIAALMNGPASAQALYDGKAYGPLIAETKYGKVRGASQEGVILFKGIPYAGPPTGVNRFKPPVKLQPWTGIRDALMYGPASLQRVASDLPANSAVAPCDEYCEYLNVWTPMIRDGGKRPVMFYSHGGGFTEGDGGSEGYPGNEFHDGGALARNYDVVVVTHNHRLGLLGYLYLRDILGEEFAASGCAGMLDIIAALQWVHDNIEEFGGDPGRVMIFGESGGGAKTSCLTAMPMAHGLFHRASVESGATLKAGDKDGATETTRKVLSNLGLKESEARQLLTIPADHLFKAQLDVSSAGRSTARTGRGMGGGFSPIVDGHFLPRHPYDPTAPEISANVPLMVGTNENETVTMYMHQADIFRMDRAGLEKRMSEMFGDKAEQVLAVYRRTRPSASPTDLFLAITTARMFWANTVTMAERKAQLKAAPVYMYRLTYQSDALANEDPPYPQRARHAMEIPFKFDHPQTEWITGKNPDRFLTAYNMSHAWASFARNGSPNFDGIPEWPAYTPERRATMFLNAQCRVVDDPDREERLLLAKL